MCRMALLLNTERDLIERMREEWIGNPHGWGLVFEDINGLNEWHTLTSDVPIPISFLPPFVEGIFHIRYATSKSKYGGTHPFLNNEMFFAHNGVISPSHGFEIDSLIIEDLYLQANGSFKDKMISVIKNLNENYYGTWNIIAMTKNFKEAIAYCDGSLSIIKNGKKVIAIASDIKPFNFSESQKMKYGEFLYLRKTKKGWKIIEKIRLNKRRWYYDDRRFWHIYDKHRDEKEKYNNKWSISKTQRNNDDREEIERDEWEGDKDKWLYDDYVAFNFKEFEDDDYERIEKKNIRKNRYRKYD